MRPSRSLVSTLVLPLGLALVGVTTCGDDDDGASTSSTADAQAPPIDPGDGGVYQPVIDPTQFVATIDNPLMPLTVGSEWVYEGIDGDGQSETIEITVLDETKVVMGVTTRVVRDRAIVDGEVVEDTLDWFAQDADGNVWYFGEDTAEYVDGEVDNTDGSWEAGVDGAQPGIVMPAHPEVGSAFRQEFLEGEAEDMFDVRDLDATITTPFRDFTGALKTGEWTPLEPENVEEKYYVPGIGKVAEIKVAGGTGEVRLVSYVPGA